nr:rhomboid family intramembrane serine protease [Xanthomonas translucens]
MLSSAFLHADGLHLFGNMLFLVVLGTLLEGAIGRWRFLLVYLLGAFGASAFSLAWRWGEAGGGLGASGAIAGLMGAFCVVWGRRPVRFFYWFVVVFDYVRGPAIALLPLWLGWELYNLLVNGDAGIGFDAHAGGLVIGALLGAALVAMRQTREAFMRDEAVAAADDRWERAQRHLGRL